MSKQHIGFLADAVLGDEKIITFRMLSRALGVNVHEAKRMLYDFSQRENARKQSSVSITYIVSGTRQRAKLAFATEKTSANDQDGDVRMQEAHSMQSAHKISGASSDDTIKTVTLVQDDQLEDLLSKYAKVDAVHIYSVQSEPLKNLDHITSAYEHLYVTIQKEDPLVTNRTYGVIQNPRTKHRTPYHPPSMPEVHEDVTMEKSSVKAMFQTKKDNTKDMSPPLKEGNASNPPSSNSQSSERSATRPKSVKRESSDLFKSFARATSSRGKGSGAAKSRSTKEHTDSSASGSHSNPVADLSTRGDVMDGEDVDIGTDGGDEGDESRESLHTTSSKPTDSSIKGKSKAERDAELRQKIFGDDDDDDNRDDEDRHTEDSKGQEDDQDMPDHPTRSPPRSTQAGIDEEGNEAETSSEVEQGLDHAKPERNTHDDNANELQTSIVNGRRRGRRRIVRKRMIKDAEGYLVTREEPGWESFSEDDDPKKDLVKGASAMSTPSSSAGTAKKAVSGPGSQQSSKKGQGNIMAFFGKGAKK